MAINTRNDEAIRRLVGLALALGARRVEGWTRAEEEIARYSEPPGKAALQNALREIDEGDDPLGNAFCNLIPSPNRRVNGATYTPSLIVNSMVDWAAERSEPVRVLDPGTGSARFLVAAGRKFPAAELIACEIDPLASILARGHLAAAGFAHRARVMGCDYRTLRLPEVQGRTLFIGNPPYVRHHLIDAGWKAWLKASAHGLKMNASTLAGLHVHFFMATALLAKPGDFGSFVTAAEWLDVNYGALVRRLLLERLGIVDLQIIEPEVFPFPGIQSTAVITGFEIESQMTFVGVRRVDATSKLPLKPRSTLFIKRDQLQAADRWSPLTRPRRHRPADHIELGELCRVHRGQATGANEVWIVNQQSSRLPTSVLFPSITRAKELIEARPILNELDHLRQVIDLPADLSIFEGVERQRIDEFLRVAKSKGVDTGFLARQRKAWWAVGLRKPAPILATYMARRPPVFVRNSANARHINVGHGLYPREPLSEAQLLGLVAFLCTSVSAAEGRTYAGGLTKFEPREMERLLIPSPEVLDNFSL